ncbi:MAG: SagB/ThcOx family dehydrogenase [bacterium]
MIKLPVTFTKRDSFVELLKARKSTRKFSHKPIDLEQVAYLVWGSYGRIDLWKDGRKGVTVPSAGATYPLEIYLVCGDGTVVSLEPGVYRYLNMEHALEKILSADVRENLARACLWQEFIADAPATIVIAADYSRTLRHYGDRGYRYVYMEAGHAGQNIYIVSASLGLGTVAVGAFRDGEVADLLGLPDGIEPIYIFPVGFLL